MKYIYETHLHTREASKCGKAPGREYADFMIEKGYHGLVVTDHFFNGNCRVPKELPWEERVDMYMSGYEEVKKGAEGKDFTVLFGIEYNFEGDEFLLYGVGREWLLSNSDILGCSRKEVFERVHAGGGIMFQAHPYRERGYLSQIRLSPNTCDGIEIYNAGNDDNQNALAYEYAQKLGLPVTAGSDIHDFYDGEMGAVAFDHKIQSMDDFVSSLMAGQGIPVMMKEKTSVRVDEMERFTVPKHPPTLEVHTL